MSSHCINDTLDEFPAAHGACSAFSVKPRISLINIEPSLIGGGNLPNADRNASAIAGYNISHARIITLEGQRMILDESRPDKLRVGTSYNDGTVNPNPVVLGKIMAYIDLIIESKIKKQSDEWDCIHPLIIKSSQKLYMKDIPNNIHS